MSFANFVQAQLATQLESTATSVTLSAAVAPYQLPPVEGGVVVLADSLGKPSYVEIIRYTSRTGLVLNDLMRAQEGTSARIWPVGSYCYQALTAQGFEDVKLLIEDHVEQPNPHPQYATKNDLINLAYFMGQS